MGVSGRGVTGSYKSRPGQTRRCLARGNPLWEAEKAFSIARSAIRNGKRLAIVFAEIAMTMYTERKGD